MHAAEERVLTNIGDQLAQHASPLVVGDGVEIEMDGLDVGHVGGDWVSGGQLVLTPGTGLVLVGKRHPSVLETRRLHLREHRHEGGEALVQPEVVPPSHGDQVPKPHVRHLVQDRVGAVLTHGFRHLGPKDHRLVEGDASDVLHGAGAELGNEQLVVLLERVRVLVGLAVEIQPLFRHREDFVGIEVLREGLAAENPEIDLAVAVPDSVEGTCNDGRQVGRHLRRGAKGPALDVFLSRHCLRLTRIV